MSRQRVVRFAQILAMQYQPYLSQSVELEKAVKEVERPKKKVHRNKVNEILELHKRLNKIRSAIKAIETKDPADIELKKLKLRYQHLDNLLIKKLKAQ